MTGALTTVLACAALVLSVEPVGAQDYTGNVDPSAYSRPLVMQSAIDARATRGRSGHVAVTLRQKAACANKAQFRAQYGPGDAKVRKLYRLCRAVGL